MQSLTDSSERHSRLSRIDTDAGLLQDAHAGEKQALWRLVLRYQGAIRRLVLHALRSEQLAEPILDGLLDRLRDGAYRGWDARRGRFRDYLKESVRNAIRASLRRQPRERTAVTDLEDWEGAGPSDERMCAEMRETILSQAVQKLAVHQQARPGSLAHTILQLWCQLAGEAPGVGGRHEQLRANLLAQGHDLSPAALRQQLRRARVLLAELVWEAVKQTLPSPSDDEVIEELCALGLWEHVKGLRPGAC